MALTTHAAFNEFKQKLLLTDAQKSSVRSRKDATVGYAKQAFPSTSDLPLDIGKLIGSADRQTIIRPLDDIDVLAVLTNKDQIFEKYRYDSQAFLYRIRDGLKQYSTVQIVGARGQAVRFFYKDAPHVAPVFRWNSSGYALPNGTGGWLTTDPDAHDDYITRKNTEFNSNLKPRIRMLKRWNNVHSKYLKSFHLEVMVAETFTSMGNDSRDACEKFFRWGQSYISVSDPAGHSGDLSSYLTWSDRQSLLSNMQSAQQRAANAIAAEQRGDHAEAIRLWRIIFGNEFPAYG